MEDTIVSLKWIKDYEFIVNFNMKGNKEEEFFVDEPEPLGKGKGPNASRLLAAAVGNCLSASLLFCLSKSRIPVKSLETKIKIISQRNEKGRLRIPELNVNIKLDVSKDEPEKLERCFKIFEDYCVVTESVRNGVKVNVSIDA